MTEAQLKKGNLLKEEIKNLQHKISQIKEDITVLGEDFYPSKVIRFTHNFAVKSFWGRSNGHYKSINLEVLVSDLLRAKETTLKELNIKLVKTQEEFKNY